MHIKNLETLHKPSFKTTLRSFPVFSRLLLINFHGIEKHFNRISVPKYFNEVDPIYLSSPASGVYPRHFSGDTKMELLKGKTSMPSAKSPTASGVTRAAVFRAANMNNFCISQPVMKTNTPRDKTDRSRF